MKFVMFRFQNRIMASRFLFVHSASCKLIIGEHFVVIGSFDSFLAITRFELPRRMLSGKDLGEF